MNKHRRKPNLLDGLKPLKKVEGRLPGILDTLWDIKYPEDINRYEPGNPDVLRLLAEHGYDVKEWINKKEQSDYV